MEAERVLALLKIYGNCPKCGNETIRANKDTLEITDNKFVRTCACGFVVKIKER